VKIALPGAAANPANTPQLPGFALQYNKFRMASEA
jgi:hypothetical protein